MKLGGRLKNPMMVRMSDAMVDAVDRRSARTGRNWTAEVRTAVDFYLEATVPATENPATVVLELSTKNRRVTTGVWCPTCSLPSAILVAGDITTGERRFIGTYGLNACADCGTSWPEPT